jgi:hypothetical protein
LALTPIHISEAKRGNYAQKTPNNFTIEKSELSPEQHVLTFAFDSNRTTEGHLRLSTLHNRGVSRNTTNLVNLEDTNQGEKENGFLENEANIIIHEKEDNI